MTVSRVRAGGVHPLHAITLAFPVALFTTAVATDLAYLKTAEIQWTNFSAWLIVGGLVFGGVVLALSVIGLVVGRAAPGLGRRGLYAGLVALMWVLGLINAFKHAQDGWSSVGAFGFTLSILCALLALIAAYLAHSGFFTREVVR